MPQKSSKTQLEAVRTGFAAHFKTDLMIAVRLPNDDLAAGNPAIYSTVACLIIACSAGRVCGVARKRAFTHPLRERTIRL